MSSTGSVEHFIIETRLFYHRSIYFWILNFCLNDFDSESQQKILQKKILLQGRKTNLRNLLGQNKELHKLITSDVVGHLFSDGKVEIGNKIFGISNLEGSYAQMLQKIEVLESYCNANFLKLNPKKSKMMIFHQGIIKYENYKFKYQNSPIEIVTQFTYLGVDFSSSGVFKNHVKRIQSLVNVATASTIAIIKNNGVSD